MPVKKKNGKHWMDTVVDIQKVLSISQETNQVLIGGNPIPENQLVQLKSELDLMSKMTVVPLIVETIKQHAISIGMNNSQNFDQVLAAKSLLLMLQWDREWKEAIRKTQSKK